MMGSNSGGVDKGGVAEGTVDGVGGTLGGGGSGWCRVEVVGWGGVVSRRCDVARIRACRRAEPTESTVPIKCPQQPQ